MPDTIAITATVERVRWERPGGSWRIVCVLPNEPAPPPLGTGHGNPEPLTVVGDWPGCARGLVFHLTGRPTIDERHGPQLALESSALAVPSDADGVVRLLASEAVTHLGPVRARAVVDRWGPDEAMRILTHEPGRLDEIPGITPARAAAAGEAWRDLLAQQIPPDVLRGLYAVGLTRWQVSRITSAHGRRALDVLRDDPYSLTSIDGFGWVRVDAMARGAGHALDAPGRIRAAIRHVVASMAEGEGHTALPVDIVIDLVTGDRVGRRRGLRVDVPRETVEREAGRAGLAHLGGDRIADPLLRTAEETIAAEVLERSGVREGGLTIDSTGLNTCQSTALWSFARSGLSIMTGGPGTGKTHAIKEAVRALEAAHTSCALAAPTGKAARRMERQTGRRAQTLHRLLGYVPGHGFTRGPADRVDADCVIVDETSMVDAALGAALLGALRPNARILLVGDADQLPSVGPGAVLRDLVASEAVEMTRLTQIMRQGPGSWIVRAAASIIRGQRPDFGDPRDRECDCKWLPCPDDATADEVGARVIGVVTRLLAGVPDLDLSRDVQVLAPMKRGGCGVDALNVALATSINPDRGQARLTLPGFESAPDRSLLVGDRVIQVKNDYEIGVFNGETGRVVDAGESGVVVDFADADDQEPVPVPYTAKQARHLYRAYALTVHKSQGSEWPAVVIPVHSSHAHMWSRQLLYTAITRASRWAVLIGTEKALATAVKRDDGISRMTSLEGLARGTDR